MAEQVQKPAPQQRKTEEVQDMPEKTESDALDGLDDLLDDIDEVLEQNAEEFVKQYIQKGGE